MLSLALPTPEVTECGREEVMALNNGRGVGASPLRTGSGGGSSALLICI
jgi:hypothetical protein